MKLSKSIEQELHKPNERICTSIDLSASAFARDDCFPSLVRSFVSDRHYEVYFESSDAAAPNLLTFEHLQSLCRETIGTARPVPTALDLSFHFAAVGRVFRREIRLSTVDARRRAEFHRTNPTLSLVVRRRCHSPRRFASLPAETVGIVPIRFVFSTQFHLLSVGISVRQIVSRNEPNEIHGHVVSAANDDEEQRA